MKDYILEICVDSVESAIAAQKGGATRLELCQSLIVGGTTPGPKLFEMVKKNVDVPVHVLLRPRFGDFCYTEYEVQQLKEEVEMFRELGADGIVIGILKPDGSLNYEQMKELISGRGHMSVTLHRAFDVCKDPVEGMEMAIDLGMNTILTSGQKDSCEKGAELLRKLQEKSDGRICIQAGGGVTSDNIERLFNQTRIRAYHMSAKYVMESSMEYRNPEVHMGVADLNEYCIYRTSSEAVRRGKNILEML